MIDYLPVYNLDAEENVLGSLLIDAGVWVLVQDILTAEDFYRDKNQWVWQACEKVGRSGKPINQILVAHELQNMDRLESCGGSAYLSNLIMNAVTSAHIEYYAEIVKRLSILRQLADAGQQIEELGQGDVSDVSETIDRAKGILGGVEAIAAPMSTGFVPMSEVVNKICGDDATKIEELFGNQGIIGLRTGYRAIDRIVGGLAPGSQTVIAARTRVGKSRMMGELARKIVERGHQVGIVSLEMTEGDLAWRMAYAHAGIDRAVLRTGLDTNQYTAFQIQEYKEQLLTSFYEVATWPIHVIDKGRMTLSHIRSSVRKLMAKHDPACIFVDHLRLIYDADKDEYRRVSKISWELKELAKEFVPVITLCQLNRETEKRGGKRPSITDLRGSGEIEENATNLILLYRPHMVEEDYKNDKVMRPLFESAKWSIEEALEIDIQKVREGDCNKRNLLRMEGCGRISDWR